MASKKPINRRQNFQTIAWFWDLHKRSLLNLDPPYQRRSVWNQAYRDYFIDTILLQYPAPAIFLYEEIDEAGRAKYNVVDGKQRLVTIFGFIANEFPVSEQAQVSEYHGKYFSDLDKEAKTAFWSYQFSVEYLPTDDESIINNVFDRINRNVAKLTPQELRHARFDGKFITAAEDLSEWMLNQFAPNFPRFAYTSLAQMKEVELTAQLMLLIEEGPKGYSQVELDKAFSDRDVEWPEQYAVEERFREIIRIIRNVLDGNDGIPLSKSRLRNQTDFYALFGALNEILGKTDLPSSDIIAQRLKSFLEIVDDEDLRNESSEATRYYQTTRTGPNQTGPRKDRIDIMKEVILGTLPEDTAHDNSISNTESV